MPKPRNLDIWVERACHLMAVAFSLTAAFLLRFDLTLPAVLVPVFERALIVAILVKLATFELAGFYRALRQFAGISDVYLVFVGNLVASVVFMVASMFCVGPSMPRSVLLIDAVLCFLTTSLVRFSALICEEAFRGRSAHERTGILVYGAGAAGAELLREIRSNHESRYEVKGFLDDDPLKQHARIQGIPVLGTGRQAAAVVRQLNRRKPAVGTIVIAVPSATGAQMREALANCRAARVPCKTVPRIDELLSGRVLWAQVRKPALQDLLGRQQVRLDEAHVHRIVAGRSVIVTGAAGSIGSELCRQLARFRPACLVAFDQAESDLFRIENEIRETHPQLELIPVLGTIRDFERISGVLRRHQIESVFHAAAYKHVPMMESQVTEAVRNNILGTWNLVRAAREQNVERFLMISSDKAVNPICVMGATKRVCERLISARHPAGGRTICVSVRFGNVLGTNGSVVPIFQEQIAAGGPIKVTHPDVRRYFMTITEAVSLVLQASSRSEGSEIFVLDMGEPVRIVDLAENMIRLAGKVPYEEIDIEFTGLRPGEKLSEELRSSADEASVTAIEKMHVIHEAPMPWETVEGWIAELRALVATGRDPHLIAHLQRFVPEYRPASCAPAGAQALRESRPNGLLSVS